MPDLLADVILIYRAFAIVAIHDRQPIGEDDHVGAWTTVTECIRIRTFSAAHRGPIVSTSPPTRFWRGGQRRGAPPPLSVHE